MDEQEIVPKLFKTYRHIEWLVAHLDLYEVKGQGEELRNNMVHFGNSYYTYPFEAQVAYTEFREHVWNNPFLYETTSLEALGDETKYCIFATSIDGYFVEHNEEETTYWLPIGFIRDELGEKAGIPLIRNEVSKMTNEFHSKKTFVEQKLQNGIEQYQQYQIELMKRRLGKKFVEQNVNKTDYLEKQFRVSNRFPAVSMIVLLSAYLFCVRLAVSNQMVFAFAGVFLGVYSCWFFSNKIKVQFYSKRMRNNVKRIMDYCWNYRNASMCKIETERILSKDEKRVEPLLLVAQYSDIKKILDDGNTLESRKIKIYHQFSDYFAMFCVAALIGGMLFGGGIIGVRGKVCGKSEKILQGIEEYSEVAQEILPTETLESETEILSVFDSDGFIFADSDSRYLTDLEVHALKEMEGYEFQDLLGFARNEIYARHGYPFNEAGKYYPYYMQYSWYRDISHQTVTEDDLNTYEKENIKLIVQIETEYGYR